MFWKYIRDYKYYDYRKDTGNNSRRFRNIFQRIFTMYKKHCTFRINVGANRHE